MRLRAPVAKMRAPQDLRESHQNLMNQSVTRPSAEESPAGGERNRLRFELILASLWLAVGLFVMPALIFGVGIALLGPYGDGKGLGTFYADFFAGLAEPSGRAWLIALGPLILICLLRAVFFGGWKQPDEDPAPRKAPRRAPVERSRVEPRVGSE